jgi:hypothetical protein
MPRFSVLGLDRLAGGDPVCMATTRKVNRIARFDGESWTTVAEWKGKEATAFCAVGDFVVCGALDGVIYVWNGAAVAKHSISLTQHWIYAACGLEDGRALISLTQHWIYAACGLEDGRALFGRSHGLVFCDPAAGTVREVRLSEYDIERPGRTIHGITRTGSRVLITGAKNLLVEFFGDSAREIARPAFAGKEIFMNAAVPLGDRIWMAAFRGLWCLEGEALTQHEYPEGWNSNSAVGLKVLGEELCLWQESIALGEPPHSRPLREGFRAPDGIGGLAPTASGELCAVTSRGASYRIAADRVEQIPVFPE